MRRYLVIGSLLVLVTAGCSWARPRYDAGNTGYNSAESKISRGNVATLVRAYGAHSTVAATPSIVVSDGHLYVSGGVLRTFDAAGVDRCSGAPKTCHSQWTTTIAGAPDILGTALFLGNAVFDSHGTNGCSGTPVVCSPIWIAADSGAPVGPAHPDQLHFTVQASVFHGSETARIVGHDVGDGATCPGVVRICPTKYSAAIYSGIAGAQFEIAGPVHKVLYATVSQPGGAGLQARDATDASGPLLWNGGLGIGGGGRPVVAGGVVFAQGATVSGRQVRAFDAAGITGCSGVPKVCAPLWSTDDLATSVRESSLAVASGVLFRASGPSLRAYDGTGTLGCTGAPKICAPLWSAPVGGTTTSAPAVANGVVYIGADDGTVSAFDSRGIKGCSGVPKVCTPLWSANVGAPVGDVEIADGRVFVPSANGSVTVFTLP